MKFWLTLVISIVVLSSALTWLAMKGGAQDDSPLPAAKATATTEKPDDSSDQPAGAPKFEFVKGGTPKANVIEIDAGDSPRDKDSSAEFHFRNAGDGPLDMELLGISCECLREVTVDGKTVKVGQFKAFTKEPGKEGVVKITWRPTEKQLPDNVPSREQRFTARFFTNDPAYSELQFEIKVRMVQAKQASKE